MVVLCHIVGTNNSNKYNIINFIKSLSDTIKIEDINDLSKIVISRPIMIEYNNKLKTIINLEERKKILKQMSHFWKTELELILLSKTHENYDNDLIFIGTNTYAKSRIQRVDIPTNNNFFIKYTDKQYAKQIVSFNVKKYIKNIIDGSLPLKYIDHKYIINQYHILQDIYKDINYTFGNMTFLKKWLIQIFDNKNKIQQINNSNGELFLISTMRYDAHINNSRKAYGEKWMAFITMNGILTNKDISLEYIYNNNKKILKIIEKKKNALQELSIYGYLYTVDSSVFSQNGLQYETSLIIPIINREYIPNILDELKKCDVIINYWKK